MNGLAILIPIALLLGLSGLAAFFWALRSGQFDDLDGAALRIFMDDRHASRSGPAPRTEQKQEPIPVNECAPSKRHAAHWLEKRAARCIDTAGLRQRTGAGRSRGAD